VVTCKVVPFRHELELAEAAIELLALRRALPSLLALEEAATELAAIELAATLDAAELELPPTRHARTRIVQS